MQNNTITERPKGKHHQVGLSFGSAGAIVRMTSDDKIMSVAASWIRTRRGATDKVFFTRPGNLLAGVPENIVECTILEGGVQLKRYDMFFQPEERICNALEASTDGGSYAVIYMNRIGQSPKFRSELFRLDDDTWEMQEDTARTIGRLSNWLHEDFLSHAQAIASAWPIMYAASSLFGGQDPAAMPDGPAHLPADLMEACSAERRFRENQRRIRAMSPEQREAFRQKLDTSEKVAAFDSILEGKRTHV